MTRLGGEGHLHRISTRLRDHGSHPAVTDPHPLRAVQHAPPTQFRQHGGGNHPSLRPDQANLEPAARAEPAHRAGGPHAVGGQRGQEPDAPGVRLDQHLGHGGGGAKVAVDLEGRVVVQQVRVRGGAQQLAQVLAGGMPVAQAGPQRDHPRPAPARVAAAVRRAPAQRLPAGLLQGGRLDLAAWVEAPEVGDVAVAGLDFVVVRPPLLELAVPTDLERGQAVPQRADLPSHLRAVVGVEDRRRLEKAVEEGSQDLVVHGGRDADAAFLAVGEPIPVLGGEGRAGDLVAVPVDQEVQVELHTAVQDVVRPGQEVNVSGKLVSVPDVRAEPGATLGPEGGRQPAILRCGVGPQVSVVMGQPTTTAVHPGGRDATVFPEPTHQVEQWFVALGQVTGLGQPVVHLRIHVDGEFRPPGGAHAVVPETLQVGR